MWVHDADLAALASLTGHLAAVLDSVGDDDRTRATPCTDWNLGALVDHVTGGNWFTGRVLAGHSADDAMRHTMERFGTDHVSREAAISSVEDQLVQFQQPGILDRVCNHVAGDHKSTRPDRYVKALIECRYPSGIG